MRSIRIGPLGGALLIAAAVAQGAEGPLGPVALVASKDGGTLYVAAAEARLVLWVDLPGGEIRRRVAVPAEPTGLALHPDGKRLIVACAAPRSMILVVDTASGSVTAMISAGHTAMGPAVTPDAKRLFVPNRFEDDVSVIDIESGAEIARVKAGREPIAAAITPDGRTVFVANHLPRSRTGFPVSRPAAAAVTAIDAATLETSAILLPHGSHSLRSLCLSADGKLVYVTHLLANFELTPTQVEMGWMHINSVSMIDVGTRKHLATVGLDEMFVGAGNPWGVGHTSDGAFVCVAHAGTHELSILSASAMCEPQVGQYVSGSAGAIPDDPRSGSGRWRRIPLPGKGPRGLAVLGSTAYIAEYASDALAVVDIAGGSAPRRIALGPEPRLDARRRGELLFQDATICRGRWQSCASCHPDGRSDALNWDLMNDGVGNFKNTKSLLLAHETPPSMAEGVRATAEAAVRAGLQNILFCDRPEDEAEAIDEYLRSLRPVPSPRLVDGRLSPAAERGKALFESDRIGCAACHPAPLYTDLRMHDVGSKGPYEPGERFDTPALIEVWRTAPYLHDGRYLTMEEVIVEGKHGKSHGRIDELTEREIADLVEYVLSL